MQAVDIEFEQYATFLTQDPSTGEVLVEVDMAPKAKHPTNGQHEMMQQIMFDPLKEIQGKLKQVETADVDSADAPLSHADFFDEELQLGLNKLICIYFSSAYIYDAFAAYFDRDNVGMPGTSNFFKIAALTDRNHAYMVMDQLNKRGGRAILAPLSAPPVEPEGKHSSTLNAFELSLALAKDRFNRIRMVCPVADKNNDKDTIYFLSRLMEEEANKIRKYAHNVAKLRKLGADEAGLMLFDDRCVVKGQDQALAAAIEAIVPCKLYEGTLNRERKRQSSAVEENFFAEDGPHRKALFRASD